MFCAYADPPNKHGLVFPAAWLQFCIDLRLVPACGSRFLLDEITRFLDNSTDKHQVGQKPATAPETKQPTPSENHFLEKNLKGIIMKPETTEKKPEMPKPATSSAKSIIFFLVCQHSNFQVLYTFSTIHLQF